MKSPTDVEEEKSKRSRTRSGCFTCRDRHMKCDEQLPVCKNCINSKRKCLRGIRLNFTQYTFYDPKDLRLGAQNPSLGPKNYRILDQSIPIASLYKNGWQSYESCRHLHSIQDLQDAHQSLSQDLRLNSNQSGFYMEQTTTSKPIEDANFNDLDSANFISSSSMGLPIDPWQFSQPLPDNSSFNFNEDTVLENFDIRNLLMNPLAVDLQLQELRSSSASIEPQAKLVSSDLAPSKRPRTRVVAENKISLEDSDGLVSLLNSEKYFWLLDLFNELGIWKASIPKYAARLAQTKEYKDGKSRSRSHSHLLLNCLLCCSKDSTMATIEACCQNQLDLWQKFNSKDVTTSSFKDFERVLISSVLIVQALLLQTIASDFTVSKQFEMILATQGRLLHKIAARFQRISETKSRKLNGYVFTIASFQALVILRFILQMRLQQFEFAGTQPITDPNHPIFYPLSLNLNTSMLTEPNCNTAEFFTLSKFELGHLKNGFQDFDLSTEKQVSDSAKLRAKLWNLCIIYSHQMAQDAHNRETFFEDSVDVDQSTVLLPNDKCIALNIISNYAKGLQNPDVKQSVEPIFVQIQESLMTRDEKANWLDYFGWARGAP